MSEDVSVGRARDASEVLVPRRFSAKYKLQVLEELDAARERGEVGRILRREGLYSSLIVNWRRQRAEGALTGMQGKRRGRQGDGAAGELARLRKENARLLERLEVAEELAQAQGKAFALLQRMSRKSDESN